MPFEGRQRLLDTALVDPLALQPARKGGLTRSKGHLEAQAHDGQPAQGSHGHVQARDKTWKRKEQHQKPKGLQPSLLDELAQGEDLLLIQTPMKGFKKRAIAHSLMA